MIDAACGSGHERVGWNSADSEFCWVCGNRPDNDGMSTTVCAFRMNPNATDDHIPHGWTADQLDDLRVSAHP